MPKIAHTKKTLSEMQKIRAEAQTATSRLIVEAMNDADLKTAATIITKLQGLKGKGLEHLDSGIDQAIAELNKYTGGGPIGQVWADMKSKIGIDNPLVKIMTFANALETGFRQIPTIVKNNIGDVSPENVGKSLNDIVVDDAKKKTIIANFRKALSPGGLFGSFKKVPYTDSNMLSTELMMVPLKNLEVLSQQMATGPQTAQIASDMQSVIKGEPSPAKAPASTNAQAEPAAPATPTIGSTPAAGAAQTKAPVSTGASKKLNIDHDKEQIADIADYLVNPKREKSPRLGVDKATVQQVLNALASKGFLTST